MVQDFLEILKVKASAKQFGHAAMPGANSAANRGLTLSEQKVEQERLNRREKFRSARTKKLLDDPSLCNGTEKFVIQKYIESPLLIPRSLKKKEVQKREKVVWLTDKVKQITKEREAKDGPRPVHSREAADARARRERR